MSTWMIILLASVFLLGIALGYYAHRKKQKFLGYYKDVKGEIHEIWGDAKDWYDHGREKAREEYQDAVDYLSKERDKLIKQLKEYHDWWNRNVSDGK